MSYRIGQGIDFHKFKTGKGLWLGGVFIPHDKECIAHSDGDVLLHALCDALLGAAGLQDIGFYFPDNDDQYKGIDSKILLKKTLSHIENYDIINIDCTVCLEKPKIAAFVPLMKSTVASIVKIEESAVSIKATTTEKMGFTGREEGIAAFASVMLKSKKPS